MSTPLPPRNRRGFKIAIICALPLEAENVQSVFDICWEDQDKRYGKVEGDHMPNIGSTSASAVAAHLRASYPEIQLAFVVGICGVVPVNAKTQEEILLGDIIISTAVIQYDFGRRYPKGFQRKKEIEDSLGRAGPEIRAFVNMLQTRQNLKRLTRKLEILIQSEDFQREVPAAKYPGATRDRLYEASYIHQHRSDVNCDKCNNDLETCSKSCNELECNEGKLIIRHRQRKTKGLAFLSDNVPLIHFGRFGSANTVMKSGVDRDRIAKADEIIAFEMEGTGVLDQYPTIVIKAACNYADSHKNKDWQADSAAMAAACLKTFLKEWTIPDQLIDKGRFSYYLSYIYSNGSSPFSRRNARSCMAYTF